MPPTAQAVTVQEIAAKGVKLFVADGGNFHYRFVIPNAKGKPVKKMFGSRIFNLPAHEELEILASVVKFYQYIDGDRTDLADSRWCVGDDVTTATEQFSGDPVAPTDFDQAKHKLALQLFTGAFWDSIEDGDTLSFYLTIDNAANNAPDLKSALKGKHTITRHTSGKKGVETKTFTICPNVFEEPTGIIRQLSRSRSKTVIIDLGNGTPVVGVFDGYQRRGGFEAHGQGFMQVISDIANDTQIAAKADADRYDRVCQALEADGNQRFIYVAEDGSTVNLVPLIEKYYLDWLPPTFKTLMNNGAKGQTHRAMLVATGGSVTIPMVADWLTDKGFEIAPEPVWGNVLGLWDIALANEARKQRG